MAIDRIKKLVETMETLIEGQFSGYLKINFSQGNLNRVEKFEECENAEIILEKEKRLEKK